MPSYLRYLLRRFGQFALVVFIGVNIAFFVTHATPIDPVEQTISATTSFGSNHTLILRSIPVVILWCFYILKSRRVKATFVR